MPTAPHCQAATAGLYKHVYRLHLAQSTSGFGAEPQQTCKARRKAHNLPTLIRAVISPALCVPTAKDAP